MAIDATIADYSGTPASGGVGAVPDPGTEYYFSAQLNGSNVFTEYDYVGLGLRYLDSRSYQTYLANLTIRYPFSEKIRISPQLRLAYRESKQTDLQQILIIPSLAGRYRVSDHWSLEMGAGLTWEQNLSGTGKKDRVELLVSGGYRYEF